MIKFEGYQTFDQKLKTFLLFSCFVRLDNRVSNMLEAGMRTTLAQRLVSIIVSSMFDETCFNRLATHLSISMFGHQTMYDVVWSPNISRLSRPLRNGPVSNALWPSCSYSGTKFGVRRLGRVKIPKYSKTGSNLRDRFRR